MLTICNSLTIMLAVLVFQEDTDNSIVSPICLSWIRNDPNVQLKLGDKMVVTGWGKYTRNETETRDNFKNFGSASKTLQKLEVPGVPIKTCSIFDHLKNIRSDIMICAGAESGKYNTGVGVKYYKLGVQTHHYGTTICMSSIGWNIGYSKFVYCDIYVCRFQH